MGTVTGGHRFEISHKAATPEDPNLVSADDIAAYMMIDSVAISTATSKAVSTVGAAAPDSTNLSIADSKGVSAGGRASVADSKAISGSVNTSVADSKAISVSGSTSMADSKAVSVANSVPILTVVAASQSVSIADSKAVSVGTVVGTIATPATLPTQGRTVTTLTSYLLNNATVNVKDYGAVGDGVTDDTAAIQAVLNLFSGTGWNGSSWGGPTRSGTIFFPEGIYLISTTLTYNGAPGFSVNIQGAAAASSGTSGSVLRWNGAAGGTMFYGQGMVRSRIRDLTFDGAQVGHHVLYCIQIDAKNTTQAGSSVASQDIIDRCNCLIGTFANSAAIAFGHAGSNDQVDVMVVRDCCLIGQSALTSTGVRMLSGGNNAFFSIEGGQIISFGYCVQAPDISGLRVDGTLCLLTTVADFYLANSPLAATFRQVHSEQGVNAMFLKMDGGGGGTCTVHLDNCSWNAAAPADDVVITVHGMLEITGGEYVNLRTGTSVPKIWVSNVRALTGPNLGGLHSKGVYYGNADNTAALWPFYDPFGNMIASYLPGVATTYYDAHAMPVSFSSQGDFGGTRASTIPLIPQDSHATAQNFLKLRSASNTALTDAPADATIGLKKGDAIKFKVETGGVFDADLNGMSKDSSDRIVVGGVGGAIVQKLLLSTAAGKIVPGATSLSHRNNADSADNLLITDAGAVTARLSVTTPVLTLTAAASKIIPGATSLSHRNAADSADNLLISDAGAITVRGAISGLTGVTTSGALSHTGATAGFFNHAPVAQATAIATPTAPSAAYVQSEATSMKTAVDAIRVVLQNLGFTL